MVIRFYFKPPSQRSVFCINLCLIYARVYGLRKSSDFHMQLAALRMAYCFPNRIKDTPAHWQLTKNCTEIAIKLCHPDFSQATPSTLSVVSRVISKFQMICNSMRRWQHILLELKIQKYSEFNWIEYTQARIESGFFLRQPRLAFRANLAKLRRKSYLVSEFKRCIR